MTLGIDSLEKVTESEEITVEIKKLCKAVGISVDIIAKMYNVNQDKILELFMQTMKQIQKKIKEQSNNLLCM